MTEWRDGDLWITDDGRKVDVDAVQAVLSESYWAKGIPRATLKRGLDNSFCFSVFDGRTQVGFARVITDFATFGYLADVYVAESHRGRGLSKWLMSVIFDHPRLQGFRRWALVTRDAHKLYEKNGFEPLAKPETYMEKSDPDVYVRAATS